MASPFKLFRKHEKKLIVIFGILLMVAFLIAPYLLQWLNSTNNPGGVASTNAVFTWKDGEYTRAELSQLRYDHQVASRFTYEVAEKARERGGIPQVSAIPLMRDDASLVLQLLMAKKAEEMGIVVDDAAVSLYLNRLSDGRLNSTERGELFAEITDNSGSQARLMKQLRFELLAREMQRLALAGLGISSPLGGGQQFHHTPMDEWESYNAIFRNVRAELYPVPVKDFVAEVPEPTDAEVRQFYEARKSRFENPYSPEPGFRVNEKSRFAFAKAELDKYLAEEKAKITSDDVQKYYEENKDTLFKELALPSDVSEGDKPEGEKSGDGDKPVTPPVSPMGDKPDADKPDADKPDADKPDADKPDADKPDADKPAGEKSKGDKPAGNKPAGDKPEGEAPKPPAPTDNKKPADETPQEEKPSANDNAPTDKPDGEKPAPAKPASEADAGNGAAVVPRDADDALAFAPEALAALAAQPPADAQPAVGDAAAESDPPVVKQAEDKNKENEKQPPAKAENASAPPANDKPPAGEKSAEGDKPAAGATPAEGEKPAPAAEGEKPAADAGAEPPSYMPLEKVEDQIRATLAEDAAHKRMLDDVGLVQKRVKGYADKYRRWRIENPNAPEDASNRPAAPKSEELLEGTLMAPLHQTELLDPFGFADTELGKAEETAVSGQRITFDSLVYSGTLRYLYAPFVLRTPRADAPQTAYVFWRTDYQKAYVPELDKIRKQVVEQWKLEQARPLAEKAAEELAAKARKQTDQPLETSLGAAAFTTDEVSKMGLQSGREEIPAVRGGLDMRFLDVMFGLQQGEVGVAMDLNKTHVYVMRLDKDVTSPSERLTTFMRMGGGSGFRLGNLVGDPGAKPYAEWVRDLEKEMQVNWLSMDVFEEQD